MEQHEIAPRPLPSTPVAEVTYEPPVVVAAFSRDELMAGLPADLTPHLHTVQSS